MSPNAHSRNYHVEPNANDHGKTPLRWDRPQKFWFLRSFFDPPTQSGQRSAATAILRLFFEDNAGSTKRRVISIKTAPSKNNTARPRKDKYIMKNHKTFECAKIISRFFPFSALTPLVGWQEGHPACKKTGCCFVGGDDLTGALHDLQLQLSPPLPPSSLPPF